MDLAVLCATFSVAISGHYFTFDADDSDLDLHRRGVFGHKSRFRVCRSLHHLRCVAPMGVSVFDYGDDFIDDDKERTDSLASVLSIQNSHKHCVDDHNHSICL